MMDKIKYTSIRVNDEVYKKLKKLKVNNSQSFNSLLLSLARRYAKRKRCVK
jgi:predicted CopG family antitoxin